MSYRMILLFNKTRRERFKLEFDAMDFVMSLFQDDSEHVVIRYAHRWPRMSEVEWRIQVCRYLKDSKRFYKYGFHSPDYLDDSWMFSAHKNVTPKQEIKS